MTSIRNSLERSVHGLASKSVRIPSPQRVLSTWRPQGSVWGQPNLQRLQLPLSAHEPGTKQNPITRTYLYICRPGCSNRRTGTPGPFVGRTRRCRRTGRRPAWRTPDSSRIRRGCVARLVRTPDLCWRTGTGTRNVTGPGTRQGETDGR